jgi:hypothetical protein
MHLPDRPAAAGGQQAGERGRGDDVTQDHGDLEPAFEPGA